MRGFHRLTARLHRSTASSLHVAESSPLLSLLKRGLVMGRITASFVLFIGVLSPSIQTALLSQAPPCSEPTFEVLHGFAIPPANPRSALIEAADGNFYGTTEEGGAFDQGTVFRTLRDRRPNTVRSSSRIRRNQGPCGRLAWPVSRGSGCWKTSLGEENLWTTGWYQREAGERHRRLRAEGAIRRERRTAINKRLTIADPFPKKRPIVSGNRVFC